MEQSYLELRRGAPRSNAEWLDAIIEQTSRGRRVKKARAKTLE
jgi:hypothetical protein